MAGTSPPTRGPSRRRPGAAGARGLRALGEAVDRLTAPLIGSQRLVAADLALAWAAIVGDHLAAASHPDRLVLPLKRRTDGTLYLRVASGAVALELQHESRRLIDRINAHLGYAAVARLKLVQAPLPPPPARNPRRPAAAISPDEEGQARTETAEAEEPPGIEDARLRRALARLGQRILRPAGNTGRRASPGDACSD